MKRAILFLPLVAGVLLTAACSKESGDALSEITQTDRQEPAVGVRLVNPYSLQTMREALNELSSMKKSSISEISATHLYVRFVPKDSAEYAEIDNDTTIFYYSYPLDYDLEESELDAFQQGREYPYEYCVFKIGQKIPDVEYEVLDSCFILEEANVYDDGQDISKASVETSSNWKELEDKALEIAGIDNSETCLSKKWSPSCTLNYWDDTKNSSVPLEGVPVRCRNNLMISHQCCTNSNGVASFSKMNGKADYLIHWKRADFKIRPNTGLDEAKTILEKNCKCAKKITFFKSTGEFQDEWKYASVFRAVHHYYYKDIDGLSRPGNDNLSIRVSNETGSDVNGCTGNYFILSDVHIYNLDRTSADIYGTVIHEMAHVAHRNSICATNGLYKDTDTCVKENWVVGVQNHLTSKIYKGYDRSKYNSYNRIYSRVITDILQNQPRDNVSSNASYTIAELEGTLRHSRTWEEWKTNVKSINNKNNEKYIDAVFDFWANK